MRLLPGAKGAVQFSKAKDDALRFALWTPLTLTYTPHPIPSATPRRGRAAAALSSATKTNLAASHLPPAPPAIRAGSDRYMGLGGLPFLGVLLNLVLLLKNAHCLLPHVYSSMLSAFGMGICASFGTVVCGVPVSNLCAVLFLEFFCCLCTCVMSVRASPVPSIVRALPNSFVRAGHTSPPPRERLYIIPKARPTTPSPD